MEYLDEILGKNSILNEIKPNNVSMRTSSAVKAYLDLEGKIKDSASYPKIPLQTESDLETGVKETEGKLDYSDIDLDILDLMAERYNKNRYKYPKGNLKKRIDKDSLLWATYRHLRKMIQPLESDEETFEEHLVAVMCNMNAVLIQNKFGY